MDLFAQMGGERTIQRIVEAFYPKVLEDPLLAPLFPEDIYPVMEKQNLFLTQFFGGPPLYTSEFGHPRMRARHMPFPITPRHADAWLDCMRRALEEVVPDEDLRQALLERLSVSAHFFVNTDEQAT
ncbi:globin [Paenibacillus sp. FJAT-26967]|uniref:globin domain-containing protein n=1 Tax=Paenibacillus sp. FJAT-26967 TaxID=1729690 RepID=UPI000837E9D3|nr:globin [Paenibacillus sp. FJAT-26967]